jgi:hypothetical protein
VVVMMIMMTIIIITAITIIKPTDITAFTTEIY